MLSAIRARLDLLALVATPVLYLVVVAQIGELRPRLDVRALAQAEDAIGTPARLERELKFGLRPPKPQMPAHGGMNTILEHLKKSGLHDSVMKDVMARLHRVLSRQLIDPRWRAPAVASRPYLLPERSTRLATRDVCFDTPDRRLAASGSTYRLRHRFDSVSQVLTHQANPARISSWPYRCEVQAKLGRHELGHGYSETHESRCELRVESAPFSADRPPPPPPWHIADYAPMMQRGRLTHGRFAGRPFGPSVALARHLRGEGEEGAPALIPTAVILTSRWRTHLELRTAYGSGPNPTQAFIVSLDRSDVFAARDYMAYLVEVAAERIVLPSIQGTFVELEVELERNVSTRLDEAAEAGDEDALALREALLADQRLLAELLCEGLGDLGWTVDPGAASKYEQAIAILRAAELR